MIIENALKMAVVGPARVMILSGQLPSEMLMRAPLCDRVDGQKIVLWADQLCYTLKNLRDSIISHSAVQHLTSSLIFFTDSPFCWQRITTRSNSVTKNIGLS